MKSLKRGKNILNAEILGVSMNGVWILVQEYEYFLSFKEFPWFKKAAIEDIHNVKLVSLNHLYWPKLDIDLTVDSLQNLEKYPLKFIA